MSIVGTLRETTLADLLITPPVAAGVDASATRAGLQIEPLPNRG